MRNFLIGAVATASLFGASAAFGQTDTAAAPQLIDGVARAGDMPGLMSVQFIYLGHSYCWYAGGWKGPGFYWCGYAWRHGYGWGGPVGWNGYSYRGGAYYHGGTVYRGAHYHGGTVSGGSAYVRGPNGGSAHGNTVSGPNGGRVTTGTVHGPGGNSASGARVTGPNGNSHTVVRRN